MRTFHNFETTFESIATAHRISQLVSFCPHCSLVYELDELNTSHGTVSAFLSFVCKLPSIIHVGFPSLTHDFRFAPRVPFVTAYQKNEYIAVV